MLYVLSSHIVGLSQLTQSFGGGGHPASTTSTSSSTSFGSSALSQLNQTCLGVGVGSGLTPSSASMGTNGLHHHPADDGSVSPGGGVPAGLYHVRNKTSLTLLRLKSFKYY